MPSRVRCPVCGQYPTLTKHGSLRGHNYPWYHSRTGEHCPGSDKQVTPLEGQTSLEDICDDSSSQEP